MTERMGEQIHYFVARLDPDLPWLELIPMSDFHYGNPFCSTPHIDRQIEYIRITPQAYALMNGDLAECATKKTKRNPYAQVVNPKDQKDWALGRLDPIKDKILGMDTGNHENDIFDETGIDLSEEIAQNLGVPYDPDGLYIKIMFGDNNNYHKGQPFVYWIYMTHGYGGARTKSAKAVKVERLATQLDADVYFMSHDHVVNAAPDVYLVADPHTKIRPFQYGKEGPKVSFETGVVTEHRKLLVKTNAYLKWGGYGRRLGFPPVDLLTPVVLLGGEGKPWVNQTNPRMKNKPEIRVQL